MEQQTSPTPQKLDSLSPRQIVEELDRYVIGQKDAKRMVAIALRNRWRRQQLPRDMRGEIVPIKITKTSPWSLQGTFVEGKEKQ